MDIKPYSVPDRREPKWIWILNLIPFLGLGYLYATGTRGLKVLVVVWLLELFWGSHINMVWLYFILSIAGVVQLGAQQSALKRLSANSKRFFDSHNQTEIEQPSTQTPLATTEEFALPTLEQKAKRAEKVLQKMTAEHEIKSKYAVESFEQKALAADKTLMARSDTADWQAQSATGQDKQFDFAPQSDNSNSYSIDHQDYSHVMPSAPDAVSESQPFFSKAEVAESNAQVAQVDDEVTSMSNVEAKPLKDEDTLQAAVAEEKPFFSAAELAGSESEFSGAEQSNDLLQAVDVEIVNQFALPTTNALDVELPATDPLPELAAELQLPAAVLADSSSSFNATVDAQSIEQGRAVPEVAMPADQSPSFNAVPEVEMPADPSKSFSAVPEVEMPADPSKSFSAVPEVEMPADPSPSFSAVPEVEMPADPSPSFSAVPEVEMPADPSPSFNAVPEVTTPVDASPSTTSVPDTSANQSPSITFGSFEEPKFSFSFRII